MPADIWDLERELNLCSGIVCLGRNYKSLIAYYYARRVKSSGMKGGRMR